SALKTSDIQKARQAGLDAAKQILQAKNDRLYIYGTSSFSATQVVDGLVNGFYDAHVFKSQNKPVQLPSTIICCGPGLDERGVEQQRVLSQATTFTRFLQDAPANFLTPTRFGEIMQD